MAFLKTLPVVAAAFLALQTTMAQVPPSDTDAQLKKALELIDRLASQLAAQEARIKELEAGRLPAAGSIGKAAVAPVAAEPAAPVTIAVQPEQALKSPASQVPADTVAANAPATEDNTMGGHSMAILGGPLLNIRGFFDFNFGVGSIANPLVFPIIDNGCGTCGNTPTPAHTTFQAGEFDLLFTSKLSDHLSFLAELVLGPDNTNVFGPDLERYTLTYRVNRYFSAGVGRFHTSIGYYNTAYHHGNWFSTAEGRPIMYLFEDSGGILPVHMVGVNLTGEVPGTEKLGLHWVAELGNGLSSNPFASESVQNFYSDRNYKATNFAAYMRPQFAPGLQLGGSWYHDGLNPAQAQNPLLVPEIRQNIESAYVVFFNSNWEFMNEGVMLSNHVTGTPAPLRSPMAYAQIARKFGVYKPYFRYQYVRDNPNDPVNLLKGTYYGPSVGLRIDFAEYAAFKLQYNHLYQSNQMAGNGFDAQVAFTF